MGLLLLSIAQILVGVVIVVALVLAVCIAVHVFRREAHDHGDAYCPSCHDRFYNGLW